MEINQEGNTLTIKIDTGGNGELSKSGKSFIVASTRGFTPIKGTDLSLSINLIRKK
jgi:hypothetical protein